MAKTDFLQKKADATSSPKAGGDVVVSEPEDGKGGNPYHKPAGSSEGGRFTSKKEAGAVIGEGKLSFLQAKPTSGASSSKSISLDPTKDIQTVVGNVDYTKDEAYDKDFRKNTDIVTLKNYDEQRLYSLQNFYNRNDFLSAEEQNKVNKKLTELARNATWGMNVEVCDIMSILNTHFMNQFEIGKSRGYVGSLRVTLSKKFFGSAVNERMYEKYGRRKHDPKLFELEKYGNIGSPKLSKYLDNSRSNGYGPAKFIFKKDRVKDRISWCVRDSLDNRNKDQIPIMMSEEADFLAYNSFYIDDTFKFDYSNKNEPKKDIYDYLINHSNDIEDVQAMSGGYIEAQYHGYFDYKDVQYIYIPKHNIGVGMWKISMNDLQNVVDSANSKGIKVLTKEYGNDDIMEIQINDGKIKYSMFKEE